VIGPSGTGKSLLCQVLAEQFRSRLVVAVLTCGRQCTGRVLLQTILYELGLPYRGLEDGELRLSLINHLVGGEPNRGALLLIVDEAHTLPLRLLEEVRLITNLVHNGHSRVRLLLAGGPALEERLASPKLESFNQRISARTYLQSFIYDETLAYVRHAIVVAGGNAEKIFTGEALSAVHRATDGIPRLINQLCDHALLLASAAGLSQLGPAAIEESWSDLQQLPTPWNSAPGITAPAADIIEFGSLEELPALPMPRATAQAPRLRTVAAEDDSRLFAGEPSERIERIEEQLKSIDNPFHPAGKIGPEVELVFESAGDPFGEPFFDEEPVVDRMASMDADLMARGQIVHSSESEDLSALLAPYARPREAKPAAPENTGEQVAPNGPDEEAIVEPSWVGGIADVAVELPAAQDQPSSTLPTLAERAATAPDDAQAAGTPSAAAPEEIETATGNVVESWSETTTLRWEDAQHAALLNPADDPVLPEPAFRGAEDAAPERPTIPMPALGESEFPSEGAQAEPMSDLTAPATQAAPVDEDLDLIIVEDDPVPPPKPPTTPPKVRRREYGQLFAQLRRG
jgi:type II secretory pathway predicted ATPase ExeA